MGAERWQRFSIRSMTYDGGKLSCLAPSALLRRYFGDVDGRVCDVRFVHGRLNSCIVHANAILLNRAWCTCQRGTVCTCLAIGDPNGDPVYDVARYAISRLVQMCAQHNGRGHAALVARIAMVAYLPITRVYDAGGKIGSIDAAEALVNVDNAESAWSLPNIRHILDNGELWTTGTAYKDGTVEAMVAHVLAKGLPIRCHFRNLRKITASYCLWDQGKFNNFMFQIVRCSLMGLFPTSDAPPSFETIRSVDRLCAVPTDNDGANNGEIACRHEYILFLATKEVLVMLIDGDPALKRVMELTYGWSTFVKQVTEATSAMRKTLLGMPDASEMDLVRLNTHAKFLARPHTKNMYKIRRMTPDELIEQKLGENFVDIDYDAAVFRYEPFAVATASARMQAHYGVSKDISDIVQIGIERFIATGEEPAVLDVLSADDMDAATAQGLSRYARDTHISRFFSFALLPQEIKTMQLDAIKERYCIVETVPAEELVRLTRFPFCFTCMTWKAPVPSIRKLDDQTAHRYVGTQNVVYDFDTKETKCGACFDDSRMFSIQMAGVAARIGKDVFILCSVCAAVTSLNPLTMVTGRHMCAACLQTLMAAEEGVTDRGRECAYQHCAAPPPRDKGAPRYVVVDDIQGDNDTRIISLCKAHRWIGTKAMEETRILSHVSEWIDMKLQMQKGTKEHAKNQLVADQKSDARRGRVASGPTIFKRFFAKKKDKGGGAGGAGGAGGGK